MKADQLVTWALLVLAILRLAHMAALEDGPFDLFARWRGVVGQRSWIGRGFHCVLCISFWLALASPFVLGVHSPVDFVLVWLGTSGAVLGLYKR